VIQSVSLVLLSAAVLLLLYAYVGYPALLWLLGRFTQHTVQVGTDSRFQPTVSVTVPAYNESGQIRALIESLLALDYPRDRLQILVVSDGSTDGTDDIVLEYEEEGVELLRMEERGGKTKAENAATRRLGGEIVVNTDASIRIDPSALKSLVSVFEDPTVGLASGRDISVGPGHTGSDRSEADTGESGYVGYEMAVRDLETRVAGIIGASGSFYAIRPDLHRIPLPDSLSRDFAAALHTIENGYRAVSVRDAVAYVPRTPSLKVEYRRKVRTITRGMETLWFKRSLMNPFRYGLYAWMLLSHKVARWLLPWGAMAAFLSLGLMARSHPLAMAGFLFGVVLLLFAGVGWVLDSRPGLPQVFKISAFVIGGNLAAAHAFLRFLHGDRHPVWEPTRRQAVR